VDACVDVGRMKFGKLFCRWSRCRRLRLMSLRVCSVLKWICQPVCRHWLTTKTSVH